MATSTKNICSVCEKIKVTYICQGCSNQFCIDHLLKHRTDIQQQFDHLRNDHDQLRQQIDDFKDHPTKYPLIEQIDQWEKNSIDKIKQQAQLCRAQFTDHSNAFLRQMEKKLIDLAQRIKEIHQEDAFNEIDLNDLRQRLEKLEKELNQPTNVSIKQQSASFIDKISLLLPSEKGKKQSIFF